MTIRARVLASIILIGVVPLLIASAINFFTTSNEVRATIEAEVSDRLVSLRTEKQSALDMYVSNMDRLMHTLASSSSLKGALNRFDLYFNSAVSFAKKAQIETNLSGLESYYQSEFGRLYRERNPDASATAVTRMFDTLGDAARFYQSRYVADNQFPLGEKDKLNSVQDFGLEPTGYDEAHNSYHPELRTIQQEYGFYDLFLINNSGQVIYSVFKELDFATSLAQGPWAQSGLAEAWQKAQQSPEGSVVMTDFAAYQPSYNAPASFVATPIFDNGQRQGVLIVQLPISLFTEIMTSQNRWQETGMGATGESYVIGEDFSMRTESRLLIEDREALLTKLAAHGKNSAKELEQIAHRGTTVGLLHISDEAAEAALSGKTAITTEIDYKGDEVLIAYAPYKFKDLNWAIISQISVDEAFAGLREVQASTLKITALSTLAALLIAVIYGLFMSNILVNPINELVKTFRNIAEGEGDLTVQLSSARRNDEIGELSKAFNQFVENIRKVVAEVSIAARDLNNMANEFTRATEESRGQISRQREMAQSIASAMTEFAASIDEVARSSHETLDSMNRADEVSHDGSRLANQSAVEIQRLAAGTQESSDSIAHLSQEIDQINSVLSVINDIAEQTSLLALNAAIEAARAGEQGRGFAVVADEVRSLSSRTQDATVDIQQKIEMLRNAADESVRRVGVALTNANQGIELSNRTEEELHQIGALVGEVKGMHSQIASAVSQQQTVVKDIERSIIDIDHLSETSFEESRNTERRANDLQGLSQQLEQLVGRFKV